MAALHARIIWCMRCFSVSWLREFVDDPYRGHVALVEFLQYLHLHQPSPEVDDIPKRKGKPDVLSRDFVSMVKYLHLNKRPLHGFLSLDKEQQAKFH